MLKLTISKKARNLKKLYASPISNCYRFQKFLYRIRPLKIHSQKDCNDLKIVYYYSYQNRYVFISRRSNDWQNFKNNDIQCNSNTHPNSNKNLLKVWRAFRTTIRTNSCIEFISYHSNTFVTKNPWISKSTIGCWLARACIFF